ncbi:MAG: polyphosphate polymerase domain-containing protein [Oscillospiraceae bacterium]|nr:polyphosphate polymerase domain-containing protein [Oscillospiraceae bacterium]
MADQTVFRRYEKKYLMTAGQYLPLRQALEAYMSPDRYGRHTICNLYYDTVDFQLIRLSIEKPVYKEKLRLRSYGVPDEDSKVFAEIKKKFKGVVYKRREALPLCEARGFLENGVPPARQNQIVREIDWFLNRWQPIPQVFLAYDRIALFGREEPELRVTFDQNIRWRTTALDLAAGDWGAPLLPPGQILMEVKIPGAMPVWMAQLFGRLQIYPTSFSKYGTCYKNHLVRPALAGKNPISYQNGGVISA